MDNLNLLRGEKVRLAAWTKDDIPIVTRWYENAEFMRMLDAAPASPRTSASIEEWIDEASKSKNAFSFGIRTVEDDQLIGLIELDDILWAHGTGWLGMGIGEPEHWGRGYGRDAISLALRFAFHEINLHRL